MKKSEFDRATKTTPAAEHAEAPRFDRARFAAEILDWLTRTGIPYRWVDHDGDPLVVSRVSKEDPVTPEQASQLHALFLRGLARSGR